MSTTTPLRVGSLFSGIGGFDLGLERAGMKTEFFVECEPYCQRVLAKHWPDVPIFNDIREVGVDTLPAVDLLCGGFPCQDLSSAGKQAGIHGERSGLWFEFLRLIGELRPRYVVVENVPQLRKYLGVVAGGLAEVGYDAEWDVISAKDVGAPHLRRRMWLVAYPQREQLRKQPGRGGGQGRPGAPLAPVDGEARDVAYPSRDLQARSETTGPERERTGQSGPGGRAIDVAHADSIGQLQSNHEEGAESRQRSRQGVGGGSQRSGSGSGSSPWQSEPDVGRVADGVPARMDRLRALGNALVPQIAEWIGHRIVEYECTS